MTENALRKIQDLILIIPNHIGTTKSVIIHTILFCGIYSMLFFGWSLDSVNLILTTMVSLEAIYLSIFIQLSMNRTEKNIQVFHEDVKQEFDEIDHNLEELEDDMDKLNINPLKIHNLNTSDKQNLQSQLLEMRQQLQTMNSNLDKVLNLF